MTRPATDRPGAAWSNTFEQRQRVEAARRLRLAWIIWESALAEANRVLGKRDTAALLASWRREYEEKTLADRD